MRLVTVLSALIAVVVVLVFLYVDTLSDSAAVATHLNVTNSSSQSSNSIIIGYAQQLKNANALGYNFTDSSFSCSAQAGCLDVQIAPCFNNLPNQAACINPSAYPSYIMHKTEISRHAICPYFILEGRISCACINNYCEEIYTK